MHELAFTEGVIKVVTTEAEKQHFSKCLKITISIGEYSGVLPECITEFFPLAAKGTIAEEAKLVFLKSEDKFKAYVDSIEVE